MGCSHLGPAKCHIAGRAQAMLRSAPLRTADAAGADCSGQPPVHTIASLSPATPGVAAHGLPPGAGTPAPGGLFRPMRSYRYVRLRCPKRRLAPLSATRLRHRAGLLFSTLPV